MRKLSIKKSENIKIKCPFCKDKIPSNATRCSHCTADLSGKEAQDNIEKQLKHRKKNIIIGLSFLGFLVFLIVIVVATSPSSNTPSSEEKIAVNIKDVFAPNKNDPYSVVLIIENKNSFDWGDCELKLNNEFKTKMQLISIGNNEVPLISFARKDGTFFDIRKYTYNSFEVQCKKPYFDVQKYSY
ncbi:MAG: hypothetical protein A3F15_01970 [Candidatus Wildermuthbacteria bacterium RIFCSPHIGHO2_12_FULL_40_12]|uniref:Zinc ribbon domain-containing protein n=1 Tax=Candidatus Wildermuthbacteria bacterium RIFCSPHIGHO2_12_FULL_40_12 TaxID=1802457 RepID=A0A1G2RBR0_9BACT|nr:MAG: hypothetical protein A3F15_01970 [Candidatus Wildermuthbacteria bacterium RIFCSPHIGHO2_12_FULL_40_12]HXK40683.1 hypothetical protein [Candidatus Paceibacterota bacterium]